ncbi:MAG: DNA replication/repair protein RecF [Gammaproteobacteria bacterium]|nr:DNA replication/repair protein RecF [Gammaproteobacteria bacterium]
MRFAWAEFRRLRILENARVEPSPQSNLITGPNGSGKSTLLEGLQVLGTLRSFRTHRLSELIRTGESGFTVAGELQSSAGESLRLNFERRRSAGRISLGGKAVQSASEIVRRVPIVVISPQAHLLLEGGPNERRRLLEWSLFHVEPSYLGHWHAYHRALRQRNVSLRRQAAARLLATWERELALHGAALHGARASAITQLEAALGRQLGALGTQPLTLRYACGWDETRGLAEQLERDREDDLRLGYTRSGPHRADVLLLSEGKPANRFLSRGQAKLTVTALLLAHADFIEAEMGERPVLLVDDFPAELDAARAAQLAGVLVARGGQVFVTATSPEQLPSWPGRATALFHVKQGAIGKAV